MIRNFTPVLVIGLFALGFFFPNKGIAMPGNCDFELTIQNVSCNGGSDGLISVSTPTLSSTTFIWSANVNNSFDSVAYNLEAGTYLLTITDAGGCTSDTLIEIEEPDPIAFATATVRPVGAVNNGQINVVVTGGDGNYTYIWTNGVSTTNQAGGLAPGTYTITVVDGNGCTATTSVSLGNVPSLESNINGKDIHCFGQNNGKAWIRPTGGNPPLTYQWNTGSTNDSIFNLSPGVYSVTISDFNGFSIEDSILIEEPLKVEATFTVNDISCNGFSDGSIIALPTGGTVPYPSWTWNGPGGFFSQNRFGISGLSEGRYFLTFFDNKGCMFKDSIDLEEPLPILIIANATATSGPGASDGGAQISVTGGTSPYAYEWDVDGTIVVDSFIDNVPAGQYPVTVTDKNGCQKSTVVTVSEGTLQAMAKCQFIFNAFPPGNPAIDVFIYDAQEDTFLFLVDSVAYLTASPFYDLGAQVPLEIKTALHQKPADTSGATTVAFVPEFDDNSKNIMIFTGNSPLSQLNADVYTQARLESSIQNGQDFQLLMYHGSKDLGQVNLELSSIGGSNNDIQNISYRDYANVGYLTLDAFQDYTVTASTLNGDALRTVDLPVSQLSLVGDAIVMLFYGVVNGGLEEEFGIALFNPLDGEVYRYTANDIGTSISLFNEGTSLVYPNPFTGQLIIKHPFESNDRVSIIDLSGRVVERQIVGGSQEQLIMGLNHLPNGAYIVEIEQGNGIHRTKVIKTR